MLLRVNSLSCSDRGVIDMGACYRLKGQHQRLNGDLGTVTLNAGSLLIFTYQIPVRPPNNW